MIKKAYQPCLTLVFLILFNLNGYSASDHRILFFKEKVFKSRWDFDRSDFTSLRAVFNDFIVYYTGRFGKPDETIRDYAVIWNGEVNRLQLFFDEQSVQVKFRNDRVEETVNGLNTPPL